MRTATESGDATFTYTYGETVNEGEECETEQVTIFIRVDDAPTLSIIEDQTVCFSDATTFVLNEQSGEPGVTYNWTSSDGTLTSMEPDPEVTPNTTTTYTLEAALGDCVTTEEVTITVVQQATIVAGESQVITEDLPSATLSAEVTGADPALVQWTFGGNTIGSGSPFEWEPQGDQLDSLPSFALATLDTGCEVLTDSVLVQNVDFRIPNLFSPNGDGTNDVFKPFFLGEVEQVEIYVYNRWGQLVFESTDPNNPGWDGRRNDSPAPSDVYLYRIVVGIDGTLDERSGEVTLVR